MTLTPMTLEQPWEFWCKELMISSTINGSHFDGSSIFLVGCISAFSGAPHLHRDQWKFGQYINGYRGSQGTNTIGGSGRIVLHTSQCWISLGLLSRCFFLSVFGTRLRLDGNLVQYSSAFITFDLISPFFLHRIFCPYQMFTFFLWQPANFIDFETFLMMSNKNRSVEKEKPWKDLRSHMRDFCMCFHDFASLYYKKYNFWAFSEILQGAFASFTYCVFSTANVFSTASFAFSVSWSYMMVSILTNLETTTIFWL